MIDNILNEFYELLEKEELALQKLNIDLLNDIRDKKTVYIKTLENLIKQKELRTEASKELLEKILKKNRHIGTLYQFSLSLLNPKEDNEYGPKRNQNTISHLNISV
ncbi:hypothetical protein JXR93_04885 [bacterium]|nr:hypothetical protein [bacterium]